MGVPTIASPTVYGDYVTDGVTGFIARTIDDWVHLVCMLIDREDVRRTVGIAARDYVLTHYPANVVGPRWVEAYEEALAKARANASRPKASAAGRQLADAGDPSEVSASA